MWNFEQYRDNTFLVDETGKTYLYSDLINAIDTIANSVDRCLVFSLVTNSVGSIAGYAGFINNRIVPAMLNVGMDKDLLIKLITIYKPKYLWVPEAKRSFFNSYDCELELLGYCLLRTSFDVEYPLHDDLALLLTTSGSTGSPKFVRQSYDNIRANIDTEVEINGIDDSDRPITTLPMNYTYGLQIINIHLEVGATILATDKGVHQEEFWQFFKKQKATLFGGVPYTYEMLDKLRFFRMDLPHLRTLTQAGGKLTPDLHEKIARYAQNYGKKFIVMYGSCEATAAMGYLPAERAVDKKGSMGIAIGSGKIKLVDADGAEIDSPNTTGELVYEGANVTLGYAERPEDLSKGDERGGKLETGDMAQFDEEGYYYIVGRKKRFLKIFGHRVSLDEVERLIKGMFDIEVACGGVDDHMYIFLTGESKPSQIIDYVSITTKLNRAAFKTVVIDEIPKNDAGKTLYSGLEKYYDV